MLKILSLGLLLVLGCTHTETKKEPQNTAIKNGKKVKLRNNEKYTDCLIKRTGKKLPVSKVTLKKCSKFMQIKSKKGGLSATEIQAVIKANLQQVIDCYDAGLLRNDRMQGKIKTEFRILDQKGIHAEAKSIEGTFDSLMVQCVISRVKTWNFAQQRGDKRVNVIFPFVFKTSK